MLFKISLCGKLPRPDTSGLRGHFIIEKFDANIFSVLFHQDQLALWIS